ncbi:uncharacterized protein LOC109725565 [Ananas comosus]|uniref:Uncharacterized protein LOC109725565 n=1 Tax=Ananas comosus TaxID=4615 RepID=A0A6P5GP41_ANACO|nr:uncharacterized protein LOC109725565 [Ananas comosus]
MAMFSDLINSLAVIDLPLSNQKFTWSNMQHCPTLATLDRFLISTEWDQYFPFNKETLDKRAELKSQLLLILEEEEILWKTRAKQRWLKEGDGNTKFFHAVANGRKRSNTIVAIEDDNWQQITNEELKRSYFYQSFKRVFGTQGDSPSSLGDWSGLYHSNRLLDPDSLTAPFTLDEVKTATFQLGSDKAPGPDGFPLVFFQTFWDVVKDDITKVFSEFHDGTLFTGPIDYSFGMRKYQGFSDKWWAWIEQCICNAKVAILVNDVPTPWLKPRRGLRQGDPLSPYLFLLVADCLARLTETARRNNQLQGIEPSDDCQTVLIQYVDDTIFFCEPRKRFMQPAVSLEYVRMGLWP